MRAGVTRQKLCTNFRCFHAYHMHVPSPIVERLTVGPEHLVARDEHRHLGIHAHSGSKKTKRQDRKEAA